MHAGTYVRQLSEISDSTMISHKIDRSQNFVKFELILSRHSIILDEALGNCLCPSNYIFQLCYIFY